MDIFFLNYLQIALNYFQNYFNPIYYLDQRMGAILIRTKAYESEYYSTMVGWGRMKKKGEKPAHSGTKNSSFELRMS